MQSLDIALISPLDLFIFCQILNIIWTYKCKRSNIARYRKFSKQMLILFQVTASGEIKHAASGHCLDQDANNENQVEYKVRCWRQCMFISVDRIGAFESKT